MKKAGEKKEEFQVEANKLKNEGEVAKAKLKKAEQETSHRRRIQNSFEIGSRLKKKDIEELQAGFVAQKMELEARFVLKRRNWK